MQVCSSTSLKRGCAYKCIHGTWLNELLHFDKPGGLLPGTYLLRYFPIARALRSKEVITVPTTQHVINPLTDNCVVSSKS